MLKVLYSVFAVTFLFSCNKSTNSESTGNSEQENEAPRHVEVYYEKGRFGGWPANNGIWTWDNEILVGFAKGYHKDLGPTMHNIDREKPEESMFARSLDGGETWTIEDPSSDGILVARGPSLHGTEPKYPNRKEPKMLTTPINFKHPDFAMAIKFIDFNSGPSVFYNSNDRGHTWKGPYKLAVSGLTNIISRTNYVVIDKNTCLAFMSLPKENNEEGRPICVITKDGGLTWNLVGKIGPEPKGFGIMPSGVMLSDSNYLVTIRRREDTHRWIDAYSSSDAGKNWNLLAPPVDDLGEGNPPSLIKLKDGRLCLTYGVRSEPYRICGKTSSDGGKSWSPEIVLRNDGAGRDIGYVRSVQRPDGKVVTLYYFQDKTKPERYIASTIWIP
jgi:hypothetical protein